jgi:glycerol-3-phosphate acyltransferase PlsY
MMCSCDTTVAAAGFGVLAYLIGAIPNGFLIARLKGVDIRKVGSGNIGATNVFRSVSKTLGLLTFVADALKGLLPTLVFPMLVLRITGIEPPAWLAIVYASLAIIGHTWPVYLKFKGGKGVATSAGALIGLAPAAIGVGLLVWILCFVTSRYVSLASMSSSVAVPVAAWWLYRGDGLALPIFLTVLGAVIILRHKANMQRLLAGSEHRFEFGKKRQADSGKCSAGK